MEGKVTLKRSISLPMLTLYGVGTIVGGGFYALSGKVAGEAGMLAPFAFFLAALLAFVSSLSFAELSARFPFSAGESIYVHEAFHKKGLSTLIGWLVITTGIVSAATLATAIIGFLRDFAPVPEILSISILVIAMGLVAAWGVTESVLLTVIITVIEVGGLFVILFIAGGNLAQVPHRIGELIPTMEAAPWIGIFMGGFLSFYAFLGFEDMVNMAEEVKDVKRTMPIAIILSLIITTLLYVLVVLTAIMTIPPKELAQYGAPLAQVVKGSGWFSTIGITIVSMLAGLNGALVQIIMAARVAYGLGNNKMAPQWFSYVHPKRRTPTNATFVMTAIVLILATSFPLVTLAKTTSGIILFVYGTVNLSLWWIKLRDPTPPKEGPCYPAFIPLFGFLSVFSALLTYGWLTFS